MDNKQIIFTKPNTAEVLDVPIREPNADEVLVKTVRSTISSGTERANIVGEKNVSWAKNSEVPFPRTSGYSSSGIIERVGENVKNLKVGDRVALSWSVHAKYNTIPAKNVHKLLDGVDFDEAALVHIATFPLSAIRKCHLEMGESAMVVGLGVLGIIGIKLLKVAGAYPIIVVDLDDEKCKQALSLGADYAFNPQDPDFEEKVKSVCGGVNVAIEVTGNGKALDTTLDCMARFGRVALLGCTRNSDFTIDYYKKVHGPGVSLIGAHTLARPENESSPGLWTTHDDAMAIIKLLNGKRLDFTSLIEEVHTATEASEIYNRLITEKSFPIVQFDWETI